VKSHSILHRDSLKAERRLAPTGSKRNQNVWLVISVYRPFGLVSERMDGLRSYSTIGCDHIAGGVYA
jgi:hypothetical protein